MSEESAILRDAPESLRTEIAEYLDTSIRYWRSIRDHPDTSKFQLVAATHYVDAYQSMRDSLLGEILLLNGEETSEDSSVVRFEIDEEEQAVILRYSSLRDAMEDLINEYQAEQGSNTPDFILAGFLTSALSAFDAAVNSRDSWYDISPGPGWVESEEGNQV